MTDSQKRTIAKSYVRLIKAGKKTIEDVPENIIDIVLEMLEEQ